MTSKIECRHPSIFKETLPRGSKWYCRECFTEIEDRSDYQ